MASPSAGDPAPNSPLDPYSRDRIEQEIAHLRRRDSVRHADGRRHSFRAVWPALLLFIGLLCLYLMDPAIHAYRRGEAIHAYLYLHHYGSDPKAEKLLATGLFSPSEIELLNRRPGSFQSYYSSPLDANRAADSTIAYLRGVSLLHAGSYDQLDRIGKLRYLLFVRWGILPPESWSVLDPSVQN